MAGVVTGKLLHLHRFHAPLVPKAHFFPNPEVPLSPPVSGYSSEEEVWDEEESHC